MENAFLLFLPAAVFCVAPAIYESHNMRNLKLPSNIPVGSLIYRLKAYDPDPEPLTFGITGPNSDLLEVRMLEGGREADVFLRALLQRPEFELGVFVTDGKSTTHVQSTVRTTEPQPLRPAFVDPEPVISVPEDAPRNSVIGRIAARGRDGSGVPATFELRGSSRFSTKYTLGPERTSIANIVVADQLDYEERNLYTLTVLALNGWTNETVDTRNIQSVLVVVTVTDVQDTPPVVLSSTPAVVHICDLHLPKGHVIFNVTAKDGDVENPHNLTFALAPGQSEWEAMFTVDHLTGAVSISGNLSQLSDLHREDHLVLALTVTEVSTERAQTTARVAIVLDAGRDRPPRFLHPTLIGEIEEHSPPGTPVRWDLRTLPSIIDPDKGRNGSFEVFLDGDQGIFAAVPSRGQTELNLLLVVQESRLLDFESEPFLEFKVIARSLTSQEYSEAEVAIRVLDVNDHAPIFTQTRYEAQIPEHAATGTLVVQIEAKDGDQGIYGTVLYSELTGYMSSSLQLDPSSGEITVLNGSLLDYEALSRFTCYAEARDGGGLRGFTEVDIQLEDVNDHAPKFERERYQAVLNSDLSGFTEPLVVRAHDGDGPGRNSDLHYEILEGNYHDKFTIDESSGRISLRESLQPFAGYLDVVVLTVRVYDLGVPFQEASVKVYIHNQKFVNRTLQVVLPRPSAELRRGETEKGLSLLTGAQVYLLDVRPLNSTPASSELSTWASYPLSASLDLRQLDNAVRLLYGGEIILTDQESMRKSQTASVGFWILLALFLILLIILIIVAAYCLCCRKERPRSGTKVVPQEANGDIPRFGYPWRPFSPARRPPETMTIQRPQVEVHPEEENLGNGGPKRTEILYIRSPPPVTREEDVFSIPPAPRAEEDTKLMRPTFPHRMAADGGPPDEDSDSGLGKDQPPAGGLRLKKGNLLEKKSLFTIAYDGMHTRHLRSNGDNNTSP